MKQGLRDTLQSAGIEDQGLADRMSYYLLASKSDNTVKKYYYSFKKWQEFCAGKNYIALPAQRIHVAIYITSLLDSKRTVHTISSAVYSSKWAHDINGLEDSTNNAF